MMQDRRGSDSDSDDSEEFYSMRRVDSNRSSGSSASGAGSSDDARLALRRMLQQSLSMPSSADSNRSPQAYQSRLEQQMVAALGTGTGEELQRLALLRLLQTAQAAHASRNVDRDRGNEIRLDMTPPAVAPRPSYTFTAASPTAPAEQLKYTLRIFGKEIRTALKRTRLTQFLDQNKYPTVEGPLVMILAAATSIVGFELVQFYSPPGIVAMWYAVAAAQYSLLKSVQPDPGSALLGERGLAFARAVHFVLIGSAALIINAAKENMQQGTLYGVELDNVAISLAFRDILLYVVLALPFIWLLGHLPTWLRSLVHHLMEQIDIQMFGGGGSTTVAGATWRMISSAAVLALCCGVCFSALDPTKEEGGTKGGRFSVFCGLVTSTSFVMSRLPSDIGLIVKALRRWSSRFATKQDAADRNENGGQGLSPAAKAERENIVNLSQRIAWDLCFSFVVGAAATVLHLVGLFNISSKAFATTFQVLTVIVGAVIHYLIPELRRQYPWRAFRAPMITDEHVARVKWATRLSAWGHIAESFVLWPSVVLIAVATNGATMVDRFGRGPAAVILTVFAMKVLRKGFSNGALTWGSLLLSVTFFNYDTGGISEGLPLDMMITTVVVDKIQGLWLRLGFAFTYIMPWNTKDILEASTFVFYPLQFPHTAMVVFQCMVATLVAAPVYPVMGSAIILVSYFRPIRFWERHFSTKRLDDTHTVSDPATPRPRYDAGVTAKNLDSSHYRVLREMLEQHLSSAFANGQWGSPHPGDIFVLTDIDNHMTAFVHIIDIGNGYCTFQLRGLEFSGTFCQMVELECLEQTTLDLEGEKWQTCFGRWLLAFRAMTEIRWRTWSSVNQQFKLPGYSLSRFRADSLFGPYDQRKLLLKRLTQAMMHYIIASDHLEAWINSESVVEKCKRDPETARDRQFASSIDPDYSPRAGGISFDAFYRMFGEWGRRCVKSRETARGTKLAEDGNGSSLFFATLFRFLFHVNIFVRRKMLEKRSRRRGDGQVDRFLHGYNAVFRGDFSPSTANDAWLFNLPGLVGDAVHSGVRMALILHQDDLVMKDEYEDEEALYDALTDYDDEQGPMHQIVCSETDPRWFAGISARAPAMMSLRYNLDDSSENREFFVVRLTRRDREYKIYKLNKEAVRGLWASQQQELLFFKNNNAERGSIQNAKTVLRNMVSQSCDEPVGYAIYVSEMAHSFTDTISDEFPLTVAKRMFGKIGAALHKKTEEPDDAGDEERGHLNSSDISSSGGAGAAAASDILLQNLGTAINIRVDGMNGVSDAESISLEAAVSENQSMFGAASEETSFTFSKQQSLRRLSSDSDEIKPANQATARGSSVGGGGSASPPSLYDHTDVARELGISEADALEMVDKRIIVPDDLFNGPADDKPTEGNGLRPAMALAMASSEELEETEA